MIEQPKKDIQKKGVLGLFTGISKGMTGLIFKPLGGAVGLVTSTISGLSQQLSIKQTEETFGKS